MKYTSAEAAKLLRSLYDEHSLLLSKEGNDCTFVAATGEDVEELRPDYDYAAVQEQLAEIERKVRVVKHALNIFNLQTKVCGMTIDELLIYLPQLKARRMKLGRMIGRRAKQRLEGGMLSQYAPKKVVIDYEYANYDIARAEADYRAVLDEIATLQTALDLANSTQTMEIEL